MTERLPTFTYRLGPFPGDHELGATFRVEGEMVVVGIEQGLVDVTPFGGPDEFIPGQRKYEVIVRLRVGEEKT